MLLPFCCQAASVVSVTKYHNDNGGTGVNSAETILTPANVGNNFGKLYSLPVDGQIYAQPLYVPSVTIPGAGVRNVLYIATEHNSVYAFDADSSSPTPLWHVNLGMSVPVSAIAGFTRDLEPEIGITSTPVIDIGQQAIYVVAETYNMGTAAFSVHSLNLATGVENNGSPVEISGEVSGTASDGNGSVVAFNPIMHLQRTALLLVGGTVYVGFGGHQDTPPYHGWIFGFDELSLQQVAAVCLSPNSGYAGLWQGGTGFTTDSSGNIYAATGNGLMTAASGGSDYGDSVLKMNTQSLLEVTSYFSPSNQAILNAADTDLGAGGVLVLPGSIAQNAPLLVAGGKDGRIFVLNSNTLGGFNPGGDTVVQEFQATQQHNFGGEVFFNNALYVWGAGDSLRRFAFNGTSFSPSSVGTFTNAYGYSNQPALSISSNGLSNGIVWAAWSSTGQTSGGAYAGTLHAFDASNVSTELWNSDLTGTDYSGSWAKWCPPTIANGKVYLATFDGSVTVFGLFSGATGSISATSGTPQSATVNTGFAAALQATVQDAGGNPLSGLTVTFTAPSTGAGAAFGGLSTATAVTNAAGNVTAPTLTANSQAGSYTVTATVAGAGTPASFNLTNLPGAPASISATSGTLQSATVNTGFATALEATVKDAGNNLLSGVTVTFTAPASGPGAAFGASFTATAVTNASGIATAPPLSANGQAGAYAVTGSAAGTGANAVFSLTNMPAPATGGAALAGVGTSSQNAVNLTSEGSSDWIHWGDSTLNRKTGVSAQLSSYTVVGGGNVLPYNNDPRPVVWTDGAPAPNSGNNTNGIYISYAGQGFSFTAPADTIARTLTVHVGGWFSGGTLTAHLSDGSATDFTDVTAAANGQYDRNYTLSYQAASGGQTLIVSWVMTSGVSYGNVTLNAAGLATSAIPGANISSSAGAPQSATVNAVFSKPLQATVTDAHGNPVSGATVTFAAPTAGAGAAFGGSATAFAITNNNGIATAPTLTANSQTGSYTVTASIAGVPSTASFALSNIMAIPASIVATAGTPESTAVTTAFSTAPQAKVMDANGNPVSGVTVTFTAPTTGAGAAFSGRSTATAITNAGGIATAPALTANSQAGLYTVTAAAAGIGAPASFALTNTALPLISAGLVQQAAGANTGNNQNTLTVSLGSAPGSGNVLVLFFGQVGASQTITSITGATWTRISQNSAGNVGDSEIWVGTNPTSPTITISGVNYFGTFQPGYAIVGEFTGISPTLDGAALNTAGGAWPVTSGSLTTASAGDVLITSALSYSGGGSEAVVGSPWTPFTPSGGTYSLAAAYQIVSAAGSYSATWNGGGSPQVSTIVLALKALNSN